MSSGWIGGGGPPGGIGGGGGMPGGGGALGGGNGLRGWISLAAAPPHAMPIALHPAACIAYPPIPQPLPQEFRTIQ